MFCGAIYFELLFFLFKFICSDIGGKKLMLIIFFLISQNKKEPGICITFRLISVVLKKKYKKTLRRCDFSDIYFGILKCRPRRCSQQTFAFRDKKK